MKTIEVWMLIEVAKSSEDVVEEEEVVKNKNTTRK